MWKEAWWCARARTNLDRPCPAVRSHPLAPRTAGPRPSPPCAGPAKSLLPAFSLALRMASTAPGRSAQAPLPAKLPRLPPPRRQQAPGLHSLALGRRKTSRQPPSPPHGRQAPLRAARRRPLLLSANLPPLPTPCGRHASLRVVQYKLPSRQHPPSPCGRQAPFRAARRKPPPLSADLPPLPCRAGSRPQAFTILRILRWAGVNLPPASSLALRMASTTPGRSAQAPAPFPPIARAFPRHAGGKPPPPGRSAQAPAPFLQPSVPFPAPRA